jgi:hypothetical protein
LDTCYVFILLHCFVDTTSINPFTNLYDLNTSNQQQFINELAHSNSLHNNINDEQYITNRSQSPVDHHQHSTNDLQDAIDNTEEDELLDIPLLNRAKQNKHREKKHRKTAPIKKRLRQQRKQ